MTSTGIDKARSSDQRIADNTIDITKQIIEDTKVFNATSPAFALSGEQGSSEGSAAGNYLAKSGDIRLGPMGNEFKIVEIINDEISVSIATANYVPWIILNPEAGLPDDLLTITTGESVFLNQEIVLQGGNAISPITLKGSDPLSNILTPDGEDLVLAFSEIVRLYFSQLLSAWIVAWTSSGGALTEPIELGFNEVVTQTPPTQTIIAGDQFNPSHIDLDQDIEIQLDISATTSKYKSIFVIFDTTGGGFTVTWPGSVVNPPIINDSVAQRISVILYTIDNGILFTHATSVGSSSNLSEWANFPAVNNVTVANFDILAVKNLDFDDVNSTIQGLKTLQFFDDAPNKTIGSVIDALEFRIPMAEQYDFFIESVVKFRIEQVATGQPALIQLFGGSLEDSSEIIFDTATDAIIIASEPGLGYDNTAGKFIYNALTNDEHQWKINGVSIMELGIGSLTFPGVVQILCTPSSTLSGINVGSLAGDPSLPSNGDIHYNSTSNTFRFRQAGAFVELGGGGSFANLQLSNLVATVRPNLNMLANRTTGGTLGADNATDSFFQIHADKINFANQGSIASDKHVIGRITGTDDLVINVPLNESINIRIDGVSQILIDGTDVDFSNQNLIDVKDVGASGDAVENYWTQKMRFPANVIGVSNTHNIFRALKNSTDTMVLNIPTNNDFIISENDSGSLLRIDTSLNIISIGASGSLLGMNLNDKSMSFPTGSPWTFTSTPGFEFINGNVDFDDNELTSVASVNFVTLAGVSVGEIRSVDATTDVLEIRLDGATDFLITDNGSVRLEFDNTLLTWKFGGSSLIQLPQEVQISDRASNPSTPPSGFASLFVINVAGAQTLRVIFDNGTVKDIANDV